MLHLGFDHTVWSYTDEDIIYFYEHISHEHILVNLYLRITAALADGSFQKLVYFTRPEHNPDDVRAANEQRMQLYSSADEMRAAIHRIGNFCTLGRYNSTLLLYNVLAVLF